MGLVITSVDACVCKQIESHIITVWIVILHLCLTSEFSYTKKRVCPLAHEIWVDKQLASSSRLRCYNRKLVACPCFWHQNGIGRDGQRWTGMDRDGQAKSSCSLTGSWMLVAGYPVLTKVTYETRDPTINQTYNSWVMFSRPKWNWARQGKNCFLGHILFITSTQSWLVLTVR